MQEIYVAKEMTGKKGKQEEGGHKGTFGHVHSPFAAFYHYPHKARFETQEKEEKIVLLLRRHPVTNLPWVITALALSLAPIFLARSPLFSFLPPNFGFIALLLWYLIVVAVVLEGVLAWFFNVYIVTDERLVDVDFNNLLYREIKDAKIDRIQEVKNTIGGVLGIVFNYGSVNIQTAGALPTFEFEDVPNPAEVARIIQELRTEEEVEALEGRVR